MFFWLNFLGSVFGNLRYIYFCWSDSVRQLQCKKRNSRYLKSTTCALEDGRLGATCNVCLQESEEEE
jgi:hypothetical protein